LRIPKVLSANLFSSTDPGRHGRPQRKGNPEDTIWALTTSHGLRVDGIRTEDEARSAACMLGFTQVISPYSWQVVDNQGRRFVAEMRRARPLNVTAPTATRTPS
jgi:hypothetical protein